MVSKASRSMFSSASRRGRDFVFDGTAGGRSFRTLNVKEFRIRHGGGLREKL